MSDSDRGSREFERSPLRAEVRLQFSGADDLSGFTADLSRGGMFVPLHPPKPVGTLLRVTLHLPSVDQVVRGYGEVVWIRVRDDGHARPAGMGVQFRHLEGDGADLITSQLAELELLDAAGFGEPSAPGSEVELRREAAAWEPGPEAVPGGGLPSPPEWGVGRRREPLPTTGYEGEEDEENEEEWAAEGPSRRRPSQGLLVAGGALLAVAVAAFLLRDPLVGWIVGGADEGSPAAVGEPAGLAGGPAAPPEETPDEPDPPAGEAQGEGAGAAGEGAGSAPPAAPSTRASAAPPAVVEPAPPTGPLTEIRDVSWWEVEGETIVVITGDGPIPEDRVIHQRLGSGRPRELIRIVGIERPYQEATIPVDTPEVARIRTGHHPEAGGGELYVVFDLADPGVEVTRMETLASGVRVYLRRE